MGCVAKFGIERPKEGPLERKMRTGKTPVLDVGILEKVRSGHVKVVPAIECVSEKGVHFVDGTYKEFDDIIMATGYKSNVQCWLKDDNMFGADGFPKKEAPNGWKGERGLYAVGFGRGGLAGVSYDAVQVAEDISKAYFLHKH